MTESKTPDGPQGKSGASRSGASEPQTLSTPARWTAFLGKPMFWIVLVSLAWVLPMVKSLGGTFPDPPAGFDAEPAAFELVEMDGRQIPVSELAGYLLVVQSLNMATPEQLDADFTAFRELKGHLRSMSTIVIHVLLVRDGEAPALAAYVRDKKAHKPNNVFLLDTDGAIFEGLVEQGGVPAARVHLLDRHARLRGSFEATPEGQQLFSRAMTLLGNWEGCDPPVGEPVFH